MLTAAFRTCRGLNTQAAPEALAWDSRSGAFEAARLVDVDVLDNGRRVRRRPGRVRVDGRVWRDPFTGPDGAVYAVIDDVLCRVLADLTPVPLLPLTTPGRLAWTALDDLVFWTNGIEKGLIQNGEPKAWGGLAWPVAGEADRFVSPPAGQVLGTHGGRVWIGDGVFLSFTEGAGGFHFWQDGASFFEMSAEVTMIRPANDGLYVGTTDGVWFLAGLDPGQMAPRRVSFDPAILGSDVTVRADEWGRFDPQLSPLWTSSRGICLGLQQGLVINLTKNRVALDAPASVAAAINLPRRYVCVLHP
uniref:Uncharacterized protein n=1 Tax=Desulfovibrio sp. U5L TaxID=596152 RepID=I2Q1D8_9BACT